MHRAPSSFDVMIAGERLGFVQEQPGGSWRAHAWNGRKIREFARPTEARQAVVDAWEADRAALSRPPLSNDNCGNAKA